MPISKVQVSAEINGHAPPAQAVKHNFPFVLPWVVTVHKCQGLTMDEIVVDMKPAKGQFAPGQAYVAFSCI